MADTGVVNLDANLVGSGRCDLNVLDGEGLCGGPRNCGLNKSQLVHELKIPIVYSFFSEKTGLLTLQVIVCSN